MSDLVGTVELVFDGAERWGPGVGDDVPGRDAASGRAEPSASGRDAAPAEASTEAPDLPPVTGALVDRLASSELDVLTDDELLDVAVTAERVASWAASVQARAVALLVDRSAAVAPRWLDAGDAVAAEVAAALGESGRVGQDLVDRSLGLADHPGLDEALRAGRVTARKAVALLKGVRHLSAEHAEAVLAEVLPTAPRRTTPQLRQDVRRLDVLLDPAASVARHEAAVAERSVRLEPADDAMAWIHAFLPAPEAVRVMSVVDAFAAGAGPGDARGLDARRADAFVDLLTSAGGASGGGGPVRADGVAPRGGGWVPADGVGAGGCRDGGRATELTVTMTAEAWAGLSETPAELGRYGPIAASLARAVSSAARWRPSVLDPRTGELLERSSRAYRPSPTVEGAVRDRDVTCTFPGCRVPAQRCDQDHTVPFDAESPADDQTTESNLATLCRHHHLLKTHGGWRYRRDPATGVTHWISPLGRTYTRDPVAAPFEEPARSPRGRPRAVEEEEEGGRSGPGGLLPPKRADEQPRPGSPGAGDGGGGEGDGGRGGEGDGEGDGGGEGGSGGGGGGGGGDGDGYGVTGDERPPF